MDLTAGSFGCNKISLVAFLFFTCVSTIADARVSELRVTGRLQANSSLDRGTIAYVRRGRSVELVCDLGEKYGALNTNTTKPQWSFLRFGSIVFDDVKPHCMENIEEEKPEFEIEALKANSSFSIFNCEVEFKNDSSKFVLELFEIQEEEFGEYVCHLGNMQKSNAKFAILEHVHLSRKNGKGKDVRSETLTVNETLWLYCNVTGLRDFHVISWLKDGRDITSDLNTHSGLFENFTKTDALDYYGRALLEHRGNYTCRIDLNSTALKQFPQLEPSRDLYPVAHSFYVRVQETGRWKLPLSVLSGEIALIGLFTLFLNWREKRVGEDAGDESDDEGEDESTSTTKNGVNGNKDSSANGK